MERFFERLDGLAAIEGENRLALWLDRAIFIFLVLTFVSAPHSIAATQISWLTGMFLWFIRLALRPRRPFTFGRLDAVLWAFFIWSAFTSVVSYAPDISIDKLRGVAIFLIFYFAYYNLRSLKSVYFVAFALIVSCMVNVAWTPVQRLIGRGVEIHGLSPAGPLAKAQLWEGDTLLEANGRKLKTPDDMTSVLSANETVKVKFYRPDFEFWVDVKRENLLSGTDAMQQLGVERWNKSRNWRSTGFYGHYTTYAEVLQLIGSLIFGLLIASLPLRRKKTDSDVAPASRTTQILLFLAMAGTGVALLMTVTRASQLAFVISAALIVMVGAGRKWFFAAAGIALPIALVGLLVLQQSRQVGFFDTNDDSIKWRQTVWTEGYNLWTESPRNMMVGVGMDTIKRYAKDWHLFDDGRLPIGHFHSMPLQLLVERGIPALILWVLILAVYARSLWRGLQRCYRDPSSDWRRVGILLGCLGGLLGIVSSGMVHYNMGDQEVAMVFFLLMALGMRVAQPHFDEPATAEILLT
ncbi:MAG: O-antigen ligase family protein [Acidobacteriota bacterium]